MQSKTLLRSCFVLGTLAALAVAPFKPCDKKLKDSDHKKFGRQIAAYHEAKEQKKGIEAAFLKVSNAMGKAQKKLKHSDVLAAVEDWERSLWYAERARYKGRPQKGRVTVGKLNSGGEKVSLTYHLPAKYTTKKNPYPMVLIIPDAGETPKGHLEGQWNDSALRDKALLVAVDMPSDTEAWGRFDNKDSGVWAVMKTYRVAKENFAVDVNRVFLAGFGKGFAAAAATAASFPSLFAGVIGRGEIMEINAINFRNTPTLLLSPAEAAKAFETEVGELGYNNCVVNAGGGQAEAAAFIAEKVRDSYPVEITFMPYCNMSRRSQWVAVDGFQVDPAKDDADQPRMDAKIDKGSNTVTIVAKNISKIIIYLNDSLVDMEKPVKFVINGTSHEELVPRNKRMMLDHAFNTGDWGRVFTATFEREVTRGD